MKNPTSLLLSLAIMAIAMLSGCYSSSTVKTPGGTRTSRSIALGIYSTDETDTMVSFDRCRDLLKPGHPGEEPMVDREVYNKCFADAMNGVEPRGQQPQPVPMDLNGDGRPDVARYNNGLQVPYGLYMMYPGYNWPGIYHQYGLGQLTTGSYMPINQGWNNEFLERGATPGYPGDPATAGTNSHLVTDSQLHAETDEINKDVDTLYQEVDHNAGDIAKLQARASKKAQAKK
jgi:hypothetical protein